MLVPCTKYIVIILKKSTKKVIILCKHLGFRIQIFISINTNYTTNYYVVFIVIYMILFLINLTILDLKKYI